MTQSGKVLVMGDDTRSFLATVRSLGRKGIEVHAAPFNMRAPALSSRYIRRVHLLPYYLDGGAEWLESLQKLMLTEQFDLIIPCEERSLLPLYKHQHELPGTCSLAIPSQRALLAFFDKLNTRQLANELGVPVAKGRPLLATDTADSVLAELALPIVAKQRQSYSWPELYVRTSVKVIASRSELDCWLRNTDKGSDHIFFEEMFPGRGLGVSVLCKQGAVLQAFEHHRAHELGGSSYYRKSALLDAGRLAAVASMAKAVDYTGVAMFEFKLNERTGQWILLEVNARPWGSLPLPVAVGVDFPYLLYEALVTDTVTPLKPYKANIYCRNLVGDLWQLRTQLQGMASKKGKQAAHLAGWLAAFGRILMGREHQDAFVLDDWRPGLDEMRQLFSEYLGYRFGGKRIQSHETADTLAVRMQKAWQVDHKPAHIVFVCQGNICRSPYAELKAKQIFRNQSEKVVFSSAGMLPRNSRPSPAVAVAAAAAHGVDMLTHRSRYANEQLMNTATAIIVFDQINLQSLLDRYPTLSDKVYFLGGFPQHENPVEVADPEGRSEASFLSTYDQIDGYIASLPTG